MKLSKGFTIIELVISIFILSIAIVGIFNAFSVIDILTSSTSDQMTATYLAQEGMEIIRNIRETNWLKMDACAADPDCFFTYSWRDGLADCGEDSGGCGVDYTTIGSVPNAVRPGLNDYLKIDPINGFYNYTSGVDSRFKRRIIITPLYDVDYTDQPDYNYHIMKVIIWVSWDAKASLLHPNGFTADDCEEGSNCIVIEGILYDWYNHPSSEKDILTFGFGHEGETDQIDQNTRTITVILPMGKDISNQTAYFTASRNASVIVNGYEQISGDPVYPYNQRDFSNPVTYTVRAADNTTQNYTVNVTVASP